MRRIFLLIVLGSAVAAGEPGEWRVVMVGCADYPALKQTVTPEVYERSVRLRGPVNDVELMKTTLMERLSVPEGRIAVLAGWPEDPAKRPTRANILAALDGLCAAAREGDRVVVYMAGHGSQQPDDDGDEPDSLDEVFLPADCGDWNEAAGIANAITDDEIGTKLRSIRDKGAVAWLVMDCCHAGSMSRGDELRGARERRLAPGTLGVPAGRRGGRPASRGRELGDGSDMRGIVGLYASQSGRSAPELEFSGGGESKVHGLFTSVLATQLRRAGPAVTFGELHASLVAAYEAIPYHGTVPQVDGDLALRLTGEREADGPRLHIKRTDRGLVLNAGRLYGIEPDTVLEVFEPGALGDASRKLGLVRVSSVDFASSACEPRKDGARLFAPAEGTVYPALVQTAPVRARKLMVRPVDRAGSPVAKLPDLFSRTFGGERKQWALAGDGSDADWLLVVDGDDYSLEPGRGGGVRLSSGELERDLADLFRVENLRRLGASGCAQLPPELHVDLMVEREGGWGALGAAETVRPGEEMSVEIENRTGLTYDLWVFHLDAHHGIHVVFPAEGGQPRLGAADTKRIRRGPFQVNDRMFGAEQLLVFAVPRADGDEYIDLSFLAQRPLEVTLRGAEPSGVAGMLRDLAFGEQMRSWDDDPQQMATAIRSWRVGWEAGPPAPLEDPTPVLRARHAVDAVAAVEKRPLRQATQKERLRDPELSELYRTCAPAVVVVHTKVGRGTGFVVDDKGHVVTNNHVIASGSGYGKRATAMVSILSGSVGADGFMAPADASVPAEIIAADPDHDLALLRVVDPGALKDIRPLKLAGSESKPLETCFMIGHPGGGLLWTARMGKVAGKGRIPHDMADTLSAILCAAPADKESIQKQLAAMTPLLIAMSDCHSTPGDSGGPLLNPKGEVIAVTFAGPAEERQNKFVYHIHLDELRRFLEARPPADAPAPARVPDPWEIGPNVKLMRSSGAGPLDVLVAGEQDVRDVLIDVDGSTAPADEADDTVRQLVEKRGFDAELVLQRRDDRVVVFYDADNDGAFDLILIDWDEDEHADVRIRSAGSGAWEADDQVSLPLLSTDYLTFCRTQEERQAAIAKIRFVMK
jgi:S1-C subfamily serine protease